MTDSITDILSGGAFSRQQADALRKLAGGYSGQSALSKALKYDGSDRLSIVTDVRGTKTMTYDGSDKLTSIAGTGDYPNKTFTYSGDQLIAVTVNP